jgi:hypothetical protein
VDHELLSEVNSLAKNELKGLPTRRRYERRYYSTREAFQSFRYELVTLFSDLAAEVVDPLSAHLEAHMAPTHVASITAPTTCVAAFSTLCRANVGP